VFPSNMITMANSYLHYEIIEKLGEGGMGLVYLAEDKKLKRKVALKFLPERVSMDATELKRFEYEAQSAAALNHPNIAHVYAFEEVNGQSFIAMEYVNGKELRELIEDGELAMEQKMDIAKQMAEGIRAAHAAGIIHRDIKSGNVMIDQQGRARIMDFGLARVEGEEHITKTGTTLGTMAYMSPEQLKGVELNQQADIWSFGVILYELFSGQLPFQGMYEPAIMYSIVEEEPTPIHKLVSNIPEPIARIIGRCLQKDLQQRYSDFNEILSELQGENSQKIASTDIAVTPFSKILRSSYLYIAVPAIIVVGLIYFFTGTIGIISDNNTANKKFLAVLPVENISNEPSLHAMSAGLAEIFSYRLSELENYDKSYWVAPAGEMRRENIRTATQANKVYGVNFAIMSSIQTLNDSTRLILELVDADNTRRIATEQVTVHRRELASLEPKGIKAMLAMLDIETHASVYQSIADVNPVNSDAYELYLKGIANLQSYSDPDSLEDAIRYFEKSVELDPQFALSHAGLGDSYWRKYEKTKQVQFAEKAITIVDSALTLNDELAPVQSLMGLIKWGTGHPDQAIMHYKKAIDIDPSYSAAHRGLAKIYNGQGNKNKALATYQRAIALKPNYWAGYKDLGLYYYQNGDLESAIIQFKKVVDLTPKNSNAYSNIGAIYYVDGQYERAREMFEKALALGKNSAAASNLANIYYMQNRFQDAASMYKIALEDSPDTYYLWGNLGSAYELGGFMENAQEAYHKAIEKANTVLKINPNDAEVLADLGAYYSDVGDSINALHHLKRAIAINPENMTVQERAVFTYEKLGMRHEAINWIKSSVILANIETQPELEALTEDTRFQVLKEKLKNQR